VETDIVLLGEGWKRGNSKEREASLGIIDRGGKGSTSKEEKRFEHIMLGGRGGEGTRFWKRGEGEGEGRERIGEKS